MCRGSLALASNGETERDTDGHIIIGTLACASCAVRYPIERGIPRLLTTRTTDASTETSSRFGKAWKIFDHMSTYQDDWFASWLAPIGPADFRGKTVFEAGCGKGRHTLGAASWGVKDIVALDLGDSVDVAFAHTRHLPNVHVVQGDLLQPPVRPQSFDLAFSIGVLHHLPSPHAGFEAVRSLVRVGGRIAVWVYGYESNEWIVRWVNPVRERVTARMPTAALYWLSLAPSAALAAVTKLYTVGRLGDRLPYRAYMRKLAEVPLREVHHIMFDQLVTPIAHYLPRAEVERWFADPGFDGVAIRWHNENSWRASATITA